VNHVVAYWTVVWIVIIVVVPMDITVMVAMVTVMDSIQIATANIQAITIMENVIVV
jgi:hypothetical protein